MLGLAVAASFAGSTAVTLVGAQAFDVGPRGGEAIEAPADDDDVLAAASQMSAPSVRPRSSAADDILARNMFCPTCADEEHVETAPEAIPSLEVAASSVPYTLIATMEADDPRMSLATLQDPNSGATGLYGPGDSILPGVVITAVSSGVVRLDARGRAEFLRIGVAPAAPPASRQPTRPPKVAKRVSVSARSSASIPGASDAIACPQEGRCVVEREFVESLMRNPAALANQAVIRPSGDGFAFGSVRAGSLPALLGFQTGDVLTSVNGEALDSIDKALALVTKLRRASNLSVTVLRKGKVVQKEVQIS